MRQGKVYLKDVIDTKPIGIFLLIALFQSIVGKGIVFFRLITAIWIALTAWMLYLTHRQHLKKNSIAEYSSAPVASGIIYVFLTSIFSHYGLSPNTELFFNLFSITALFLMFRYQHVAWFFIAGLLLGLGFMIKYVVLFDAIPFGFFYIWLMEKAKKPWMHWFVRCALMAIGFFIPLLIVWMYYRQIGLEDTFLFFSFELNSRYFTESLWQDNVIYGLESFLRFFPVTFWFLYCCWNWRTTGPNLPVLGFFWIISVMIIILIPGRHYFHYFIQCFLPLSLLAGSFFDERHSPGRALAWMRKPSVGYSILGLFMIINLFYQKKSFIDRPDYPRQVASFLKPKLQPGDIIYTGQYHPIIYLLTGTTSPTPYVHNSLLWTQDNSFAIDVSPTEEWSKIMAQHPRFVVMRLPFDSENPLYHYLEESYIPIKTFGDAAGVYERKEK